jgi:myo-inositol-1-phosphate synthase
LFEDRGVRLDKTYQLNFGGNTDFYNMLERSRLTSKKISKTNAVQSQLEKELPTDDVHIGPSDHVPWLEDRKWAYIRLEGTSWGDQPLNIELKLEVEDSPNSAGVAIDAIRSAKIAMDKGISGAIEPASAYFMKSPPVQMRDDDARVAVMGFAEGNDPKALGSAD